MSTGRSRTRVSALVVAALVVTQLTVAPLVPAAHALERYVQLSHGPNGSGWVDALDMDAAGNRIAFTSREQLATTDDESFAPDLYVRDRSDGSLHHVDGAFPGTVSEGDGAYNPHISADGRFAAFESSLVEYAGAAADTNGATDVFRYEVDTGQLVRASLANGGGEGPADTHLTAISGAGTYVAVETTNALRAEDVVAPGTPLQDVYVVQPFSDPASTETTWVSHAEDAAGLPTQANGPSEAGDVTEFIAGVGQFAVFASTATNLVPGGTPADGASRVYLRNLITGAITMISPGEPAGDGSWSPRISDDGATVVYLTDADPIGGGAYPDVQVVAYDVAGGGTHTLLTPDPSGTGPSLGANDGWGGDRPDLDLQLTSGGQTATVLTGAVLVSGDTPGTEEPHAIDLRGSTTRLLGGVTGPVWDVRLTDDPQVATGFVTDDALALSDTNGISDAYVLVDETPPPAPPASLSVTTTGTAPVGLDQVPIHDIPAERIPFASVEVGATPLRAVELASTPLRAVPLRAVPLRAVGPAAAPLRAVPLRAVPLRAVAGSWEQLLVGTPYDGVPLESLTFGQIVDLIEEYATSTDQAKSEHPIVAVALTDIDLSATPLRAVGIASIALGATPLRAVPLRAVGSNCESATDALCDWRHLLDELGITIQLTDTTTLLELDLAGTPLRAVPLRAVPLRAVDLAQAPLRAVPLRAVAVTSAPLRAVPLRAVDIDVSPLRAVPIASLDAAARERVFDCSEIDCASTSLVFETAWYALRSTATLGDVVDLFAEDYTIQDFLGDLRTDLDMADPELAATVDGALTLGAVLLGLLLQSDFPWEELPVEDMGLQDVAPQPDGLFVHVETTPGPLLPEITTYEVSVELPARARYRGGSAVVQAYQEVGTPTDYWIPLDDPVISGQTLTFTVPHDPFAPVVTVGFGMLPGLRLQEETISASSGGQSDTSTFTITERHEDGPEADDPSQAQPLPHDTLVIGHLGTPGDVDWFDVADPGPGKRISLHLSGLELDGDLVLYRPSTAVDAAAPREVPMRAPYVPTDPLTDDPSAAPLAPQTLDDIPLAADLPVADVSARRGTGDEVIDIPTGRGTGAFTIQVSAYNGSSSEKPYVLRVRVVDDPAGESCDPYRPTAGTGELSAPSTIRKDADTLFVVNRHRLGRVYGDGAADTALQGLDQFIAEQPGDVKAAVLGVDADGTTQRAYDEWDEQPCSAAAANAVVESITTQVHAAVQAAPSIRSVVLVGGDVVVPFARTPDLTTIANEREYAPAVGPGTATSGAFSSEHVLSDAPYADLDPIPFLNRQLFVPDLAIGRLVETPTDIGAALDAFVQRNGVLDASTALVAGYDFLTDGSKAVSAGLRTSQQTTVTDMIDDVWGADDLREALLEQPDDTGASVPAPSIASVNAHFDHHRLLPAHGNATANEDDLVEVSDVVASPDDTLDGRLLFSMGCHSGLNMPDVTALGATVGADWAQTLAAEGAVYVGNTGFGYGDDAIVALSEHLMSEFAERVHTMTVGDALTFAKQEYLAMLGAFGAYDEKVLGEATMFGLPMYRLETAQGAPAPGPVMTPATDLTTGLPAATTTVSPTFVEQAQDDGTSLHLADGELPLAVHGRPIQPRVDLDVTAEGAIAKGALVTGIVSRDVDVAARFARPIIHAAENEPALPADVAFPGTFQSVNRHTAPSGQRDRLVLVPGQFVPDDDPGTPAGTGVQRLFEQMDVTVYYGSETDEDWTPPRFATVEAAPAVGGMTFDVAVDDVNGVARVLVLYLDSSGEWKPAELQPGGVGWTSVAPAPVSGTAISYFVQAVDALGNVATTSDKDTFYEGAGDVTPPTVEITAPTDGAVFELGDVVTGEYACSDTGTTPTCAGTVGGVAVASGELVPTTAAGSHTLRVTATDQAGNTTTEDVNYTVTDPDREPPTAIISQPLDGSQVVVDAALALATTCTDDRAGVACVLEVDGTQVAADTTTLPTSTLGAHTVVLTATDRAGNQSTDSVTYTVVEPEPGGDTTPPTISFAATPTVVQRDAVVLDAFSCQDDSGTVTCERVLDEGGTTTGATLPTGTVGQQTILVRATDGSGNRTEASFTYTVTWVDPAAPLRFLAPVHDADTYNVVKAGSAVPLKFQLFDLAGAAISDRGVIGDIGYITEHCDSASPVDETTVPATMDPSGLHWDAEAQQWVYVWKTPKQKGTCVRLTVQLTDGHSVVTARFRFR